MAITLNDLLALAKAQHVRPEDFQIDVFNLRDEERLSIVFTQGESEEGERLRIGAAKLVIYVDTFVKA